MSLNLKIDVVVVNLNIAVCDYYSDKPTNSCTYDNCNRLINITYENNIIADGSCHHVANKVTLVH